MRIYDRFGSASSWFEVQKGNNLVYVLEGGAQRWCSTVLRETAPDAPLENWAQWKKILRRDFAGEHVQEWALMKLQER